MRTALELNTIQEDFNDRIPSERRCEDPVVAPCDVYQGSAGETVCQGIRHGAGTEIGHGQRVASRHIELEQITATGLAVVVEVSGHHFEERQLP